MSRRKMLDDKEKSSYYSIVRGVSLSGRMTDASEEISMKPKSPRSIELYNILKKRGYPEDFCDGITKNLNTDWTANRMIGYLSHYQKLPPEEIVDEMLAILSDRNRIMQKHATQEANDKWNLIMAQGLGENLDEE